MDEYDFYDLSRISDEEREAEELTGRIVEFFRKHPDIPPTEENIIERFPNDDESLIIKVIDKVIEGLSMTDEQRQNNMAAVKSNPMLGEMMSPWKDYALEFLNLLKKY